MTDKGYSADRIRRGSPGPGIGPVLPMRVNEHERDRGTFGVFDKGAYRGRNVVERAIGRLNEFRRLATRYGKPASAHLAMPAVADIVLHLRVLDS